MNLHFKLSSPVFKDGELIPPKYTSDGDNINPPLTIEEVPDGTKSMALIVDDPDAPHGTFTHWLVKNIPPKITNIQENSVPGIQIANSWKNEKWGGPSPPSGTHRYFFKLFALSVDKLEAKNLKDFYSQCDKYKIGMALLMGRFTKPTSTTTTK